MEKSSGSCRCSLKTKTKLSYSKTLSVVNQHKSTEHLSKKWVFTLFRKSSASDAWTSMAKELKILAPIKKKKPERENSSLAFDVLSNFPLLLVANLWSSFWKYFLKLEHTPTDRHFSTLTTACFLIKLKVGVIGWPKIWEPRLSKEQNLPSWVLLSLNWQCNYTLMGVQA